MKFTVNIPTEVAVHYTKENRHDEIELHQKLFSLVVLPGSMRPTNPKLVVSRTIAANGLLLFTATILGDYKKDTPMQSIEIELPVDSAPPEDELRFMAAFAHAIIKDEDFSFLPDHLATAFIHCGLVLMLAINDALNAARN